MPSVRTAAVCCPPPPQPCPSTCTLALAAFESHLLEAKALPPCLVRGSAAPTIPAACYHSVQRKRRESVDRSEPGDRGVATATCGGRRRCRADQARCGGRSTGRGLGWPVEQGAGYGGTAQARQ